MVGRVRLRHGAYRAGVDRVIYDEFIRPGRGAANAAAEAEDATAAARLARLLQEIETNSHSASHDRKQQLGLGRPLFVSEMTREPVRRQSHHHL